MFAVCFLQQQKMLFLTTKLYTKKTCTLHTADSKKKVPGMYTHSMETIYLSYSAHR